MELGYLDTPEEWRDLFIMMYCAAGVIVFLVTLIFITISGIFGVNILSRTRKIIKENVQPAAANIQETTETVRGTTTFVSDNAVKPIVKVYGVAAGARRFVNVASKLAGSGKKDN